MRVGDGNDNRDAQDTVQIGGRIRGKRVLTTIEEDRVHDMLGEFDLGIEQHSRS